MKRQSGQRYQVNEADNLSPLQKWGIENTPKGLIALATCHRVTLEAFYPELYAHTFSLFFLFFFFNCSGELLINVNHLALYEESDDSSPFCYFQPSLACFFFVYSKYTLWLASRQFIAEWRQILILTEGCWNEKYNNKRRDLVAMKNEINFVLEMREAGVNKLQIIVEKISFSFQSGYRE